MTERFAKPLSFGQTLKEIFANYGPIFKHVFWLVFIITAISTIVYFLIGDNAIGMTLNILLSVASLFFYAWILDHADNYLMGQSSDLKESLKVARKRFLPLLGLTLLYLALVGILFLFGYSLYLLGKTLHIEPVMIIVAVVLFIALLLFIVFSVPALVLDGMSPLKSMEYSARLVWKHWWHVLGVFLVILIPVLLLNALGMFLIGFFGLLLKHSPVWIPFTIAFIIQFLLTLVVYPLMISALLVLYHDLKGRLQLSGYKHMVDRSKP